MPATRLGAIARPTFAPLRWYDASLKELDRAAVLDAVIRGDWPAHRSLVLVARDLTP